MLLFSAYLDSTISIDLLMQPFCTIEPNVARVSIPDARLDRLAVVNKSAKTVYAQLEFVDIAGLVRGAAEGKGLGNKFLGNIRECSAIVHLLRCFDNEDIIHVEEQGVDPVRDLHTIETELILSDLQSVEKRLENAEKKRAKGAGASEVPVAVLRKVQELLAAGTPISRVGSTVFDKEGKKAVEELQLLSAKPVIYVCNVDEKGAADNGNDMTKAVQKEVMALNPNSQCLIVCARLEEEASGLSEADQKEFLAAVGLNTTGLEKIITASNKLLNLQSYYTVGPTQSVAWSHVAGIAGSLISNLRIFVFRIIELVFYFVPLDSPASGRFDSQRFREGFHCGRSHEVRRYDRAGL
jgi:GTP-binding protein YchF